MEDLKSFIDLGSTSLIAFLLIKIIYNDLKHLNESMLENNNLLKQILEHFKGK